MRNYWLDRRKQHNQDALSLQELAESNDFLCSLYDWQFVQNERAESRGTTGRFNRYRLDHSPVGSGTLTGTIYLGVDPIQVFCMTRNGHFLEMTDPQYTKLLKSSDTKVTNGNLDLINGMLDFEWNQEPGEHHIIVSYEYNIERQYDM